MAFKVKTFTQLDTGLPLMIVRGHVVASLDLGTVSHLYLRSGKVIEVAGSVGELPLATGYYTIFGSHMVVGLDHDDLPDDAKFCYLNSALVAVEVSDKQHVKVHLEGGHVIEHLQTFDERFYTQEP